MQENSGDEYITVEQSAGQLAKYGTMLKVPEKVQALPSSAHDQWGSCSSQG